MTADNRIPDDINSKKPNFKGIPGVFSRDGVCTRAPRIELNIVGQIHHDVSRYLAKSLGMVTKNNLRLASTGAAGHANLRLINDSMHLISMNKLLSQLYEKYNHDLNVHQTLVVVGGKYISQYKLFRDACSFGFE
jgi:hypothetical protein